MHVNVLRFFVINVCHQGLDIDRNQLSSLTVRIQILCGLCELDEVQYESRATRMYALPRSLSSTDSAVTGK